VHVLGRPVRKPQMPKAKSVKIKEIQSILEINDSARIRTWMKICSRCGLCAESCFYYLANDNNPKLSPAYKVQQTLGKMIKRKGRVDFKFLEACFEILWFQCTLCKRCSLYCPFGIDIATMMAIGRSICHSQGLSPETLVEFTENHKNTGNHMGLPAEELVDVCEWMAEENQEVVKDLQIPIDKSGAKYMYTINPREAVYYPQDIGDAAMIFALAGESWTIPSFGWDCTNLPMFAGDRQLAGLVVNNVYKKAMELGVQKILITECGHAYRSLAFEGPYMAGYTDGKPPVEVVHFVRLLYEYLRDGKIQIDPEKRLKEPVTYQDPCNVSRNGGLWREAREIISCLAEDFRDMSPNREHNHCCGGGGGIMPMGPDFKPGRMIAGKVKAEQIKATSAKLVIAPCHNCYDQIGDLGKKYELDITVRSFKELICEMMVVPEHLKPDLN